MGVKLLEDHLVPLLRESQSNWRQTEKQRETKREKE